IFGHELAVLEALVGAEFLDGGRHAMSREVSPERGHPPQDVWPRPDVPSDRGGCLLIRYSRCLGLYALFVFLGRVSRASVSARVLCAKSSTSTAARRSTGTAAAAARGTRLA